MDSIDDDMGVDMSKRAYDLIIKISIALILIGVIFELSAIAIYLKDIANTLYKIYLQM